MYVWEIDFDTYYYDLPSAAYLVSIYRYYSLR